MVKNPDYPNLSSASIRLQDMVTHYQLFSKDCLGYKGNVIDPALMKSAQTNASLGIETAVLTYVLFKLKAELPRIQNATAQTKLIDELREYVKPKNIELGADIRAKLGL
jgi:hypothetical protein